MKKPTSAEIQAAKQTVRTEGTSFEVHRAASRILVAAGICPECAAEGRQTSLAEWDSGNSERYAGRECYECEGFFKCGEQPILADSYAHSVHEDDCRSDADPGL